ncbi:SF3 helicase domain-containing protein [Trichonephila clavata]|uniref:SF3 helicase domain-containing protein n=1 Tax=Trichonephila clavata TaxID=2740835 RepID=A0A8X6KIX3_TRICU|nr:SF3 helicase domain-containing protein [Trichonephila clavata]
MVNHLRGVLDKDLLPLLDRMEQVGEEHTQVIMRDFTLQTIIFCGNNLCERYTRYRDKLKQIVHDSRRAILSISTSVQLTEMLRNLQESFSHSSSQITQLVTESQCLLLELFNGILARNSGGQGKGFSHEQFMECHLYLFG